jgi:hypothetical protein
VPTLLKTPELETHPYMFELAASEDAKPDSEAVTAIAIAAVKMLLLCIVFSLNVCSV